MLKKTSRPQGQIRIIAGHWRGRKLPVISAPHLRPTPDRVRETLFNWLSPVIVGTNCLDCFAGSGVLGLEALSRSAHHVVFIDKSHEVIQQLDKNLTTLHAENGQVIQDDILLWLKQEGTPFDIIFLDPPFKQTLLNPCIALLEQCGWLAESAWIYVESAAEDAPPITPPTWQLYREKVAGQVSYRLYHRQNNASSHQELNHVLD